MPGIATGPPDLSPTTKRPLSHEKSLLNRSGGSLRTTYVQVMKTKTAVTNQYGVDLAIPGGTEWCLDTRRRLLKTFDDLANSPHSEALGIMPAVQVLEPDDESEPWELCLSYVEIPGSSTKVGIERALAVTEQLFGKSMASLPAMRLLVWDHSSV